MGAIEILTNKGYTFSRVAGTSADAIVGPLVATGMPIKTVIATMQGLDYSKFRDKGKVDTFGIGGQGLSLFFEKGIYEGRYLRTWLIEQLEGLGVRTFADLKLTESWAEKLPPEQRYRLVVASDVSRGRLVRLPWDYHLYGLDPDEQLVADAVRASMSIPFFYEPAKLKGRYLVGGGLLSNFPIALFDSVTEWPTIGIKLSSKEEVLRLLIRLTIRPQSSTLCSVRTIVYI